MSIPRDIADVFRMVEKQKAEEAEAAGQMTLGAMIAALKVLPQNKPVVADVGGSLGSPDSYRGYYEQLAFEPVTERRTVSQVLADAEAARGQTFTGYKGGEYLMTGTTMVWISAYGRSDGPRIVGVEDGRDAVTIRTAPDDYA